MPQKMSRIGGIMLTLTLAGCGGDDSTTAPNDVDRPAISVADVTLAEGNTALFNVSLDHPTDHDVTFQYATSNGTATAGTDYTAVSGSDTIGSGQASTTILVLTIDDAEIEPNETFSVTLSSITGATVGREVATATVTDNDRVSFALDVQPLLRTSCGKLQTCHGGALPGGEMFIDTSASYANVMAATGQLLSGGGPVVIPGNSSASTLYTQTTDNYNQAFSRMPKGFAPLSVAQQELIRDWIDQGAQDN